MREPEIDADDFAVIARKYAECTGKWTGTPERGFAGARWDRDRTGELVCSNYVLTKGATRRMLSQIDSERKTLGDRAFFVKKYLVS